MAKTKQHETSNEMIPPPRLPPQFMFAVSERVSGHGIVGEVLTQDGSWTITIQQVRGGLITVGTELLGRA